MVKIPYENIAIGIWRLSLRNNRKAAPEKGMRRINDLYGLKFYIFGRGINFGGRSIGLPTTQRSSKSLGIHIGFGIPNRKRRNGMEFDESDLMIISHMDYQRLWLMLEELETLMWKVKGQNEVQLSDDE